MFGRVSKMNRLKGKGQFGSDRVQNPHDPDATYAVTLPLPSFNS
jgi:hypothetical protein